MRPQLAAHPRIHLVCPSTCHPSPVTCHLSPATPHLPPPTPPPGVLHRPHQRAPHLGPAAARQAQLCLLRLHHLSALQVSEGRNLVFIYKSRDWTSDWTLPQVFLLIARHQQASGGAGTTRRSPSWTSTTTCTCTSGICLINLSFYTFVS